VGVTRTVTKSDGPLSQFFCSSLRRAENKTIENWVLNPKLETNKGAKGTEPENEAIENWVLNPGLETNRGASGASKPIMRPSKTGRLTPGTRPTRASSAPLIIGGAPPEHTRLPRLTG